VKRGYVYIVTNKRNGTLYIGVTSNLVKRIFEHKNKFVEGFCKRYGLTRLVYYEAYDTITDAILKEKQMKKWNREWKLRRINDFNESWADLYEKII
jgi:putative endonuclease